MKKTLLRYAGAVLALTAVSTVATDAMASRTEHRGPAPLAFARKANPKGVMNVNAQTGLASLRQRVAASATPDVTLDKSNEIGYLNGPQGEIWYYVAEYDYEMIQHEYYTEKNIVGFTYTVYDASLKQVGKVHDKVHLYEGEVGVSGISIDPEVTRKFFNVDDKYEIVVGVAAADGNHVVKTRSCAYSVGGAADADGNTKMIVEIPGYIVDAVDTAQDRWSEKYFITFMTETSDEITDFDNYMDYLATFKTVMTTYKYGGYGQPSPISTIEIPMLCMPGDGMSTPCFFSKKAGDKYYFITQEYEKSFFVDPTGMGGNEDITPDNSLIIRTYSIDGPNATKLTPGRETVIKAEPDPQYLCSYYGIGTMLGTDDVDLAVHGTPQSPAYYVAVQNYSTLADETYTTMYYMYDANGTRKATIAEYADAAVSMTDYKGLDPEIMFVLPDIEGYIFQFVNLRTFEKGLSLTSAYQGLNLTTSIDRRPAGDSYEYVCEVRNGYETEDNCHVAQLAVIAPDGTVKPCEEFNLGQNIAYAQFYIEGHALTPYLFNTDDKNEYMVLVKRYTDPETMGSTTHEELLVLAEGVKEPLLAVSPDASKGVLASIVLVGQGINKRLMVVYQDEDYRYTQDFYDLPLTSFAGGEGTQQNPYQIATVADLQAIAGAPKAHYTVVNDFDAANFSFAPIETFTGTLDGGYHTISNLDLERANGSVGIFVTAQGAQIKNLNFNNPSMTLTASNLYSGLIAGTLAGTYVGSGAEVPTGAVIDDVHVNGLKVIGLDFDDSFGGMVGHLTLGSTITNSYVNNASIYLPQSSAAGIAGEMLTGSSVKTSAFRGNIDGATVVGGIAASAVQGCTLSNNHVTAYLQGKNTMGGIVAESSRAMVDHNVFYGTLKATEPSRWTGSLAVGGIVGQLLSPTTEDKNPDALCVTNNIADISELIVPAITANEEWPGQNSTVHRIVGWTGRNARIYPEDGEVQADHDKGLADNHATAVTAPYDNEIAAQATTVEGATVDHADINDIFLAGLGYAHGVTAETPWNTATNRPSLHFENSLVIEKPQYNIANLDAPFFIPVIVTSRTPLTEEQIFADLVVETDETHLEMTGNYNYDGRTLNIELKPLKQGNSRFALSSCGSNASTRVITGAAGVSDIVTDDDANAPVEYFNLQGVRLDNPVPGTVVIRRQGSTVTKVLID